MSQKMLFTSAHRKRRGLGALFALALACWTGTCLASELSDADETGETFHRNGSAPALDQNALSRSVTDTLASLRAPLDSLHVTSQYGWRDRLIKTSRRVQAHFHYGVDYGAPRGTPVRVAQDGVIQTIGKKRGFGYYIRVAHENGVETAYAHLASFVQGLRRGEELNAGDVIGFVGTTGRATGPHLHYEVLVNGVPIDPENRPDGAAPQAQAAGKRFSAALP